MSNIRQRPFSVNSAEYPFDSHWFERNGSVMHYLDEGDGTPVLLLHGNPAWSFLYRKVIKQLRGSCRLIAPDLPGFGMSDHPPNYGYTPQEHAEWVNALVDHLNLGSFILEVQDWGGPIGMSVAVKRPDSVKGLVIANTFCWKVDDIVWRIFSAIFGSALGRYLVLQRDILNARMLPSMFIHENSKSPDVLSAYRAPFPTPESRKGIYIFAKSLMKSGDWLSMVQSKLSALEGKPVELLFGMKDPFFGKEYITERWRDQFPDANVVRVPDAGHFLEEDAPDHIVAAIRRVLTKL